MNLHKILFSKVNVHLLKSCYIIQTKQIFIRPLEFEKQRCECHVSEKYACEKIYFGNERFVSMMLEKKVENPSLFILKLMVI